MRCNLRTVYGPKSVFTICTNRTDRQTVQDRLSDKTWKYSKCPKWDAIYGLYTDRKVPLRCVFRPCQFVYIGQPSSKQGFIKGRALSWVFASLVTEAPLKLDTRVQFLDTGTSLNILNKEKVACESLLLKSFHYARLRFSEQLVTIPAQPCQVCVLICLFRIHLLNEAKIERQIN